MISLDVTHESLSGLRLFMYPVGFAAGLGWNNLCPLYRFGTQNGLDTSSTLGSMPSAHPSIHTGTPSPSTTAAALYSYWNDIWPDDSVKDITVIARVVYRGADPGGGGGSFFAGARGSGNNGGFLFGVWDAGGSDEGFGVFLYSLSGAPWVFTDQRGFADVINVPTTVAFTYKSEEQRLTIYRDGAVTRTATDTSRVWTPYVNEATKQFTIGRADAGFIWPGEVGWVMVFGSALPEARIAELMRDAEWPFVWEDPPFVLEDAEVSFATTITVNITLFPSTAGAVTFITSIDAEAVIDGDLVVEPEPTGVGMFTTAVAVASTTFFDFPEFGVFITGVGVGSTMTTTAPLTFITSVGVGVVARTTIDSRIELIDTGRYKR